MAYDADCGPCTTFKRVVDFLDRYDKIDFVSFIDANNSGILDEIPFSIRFSSFHLIFPTGKIMSGSDALLDLIKIFPLGFIVSKSIEFIPGGKNIVKFVYHKFSLLRNRSSCNINKKL